MKNSVKIRFFGPNDIIISFKQINMFGMYGLVLLSMSFRQIYTKFLLGDYGFRYCSTHCFNYYSYYLILGVLFFIYNYSGMTMVSKFFIYSLKFNYLYLLYCLYILVVNYCNVIINGVSS